MVRSHWGHQLASQRNTRALDTLQEVRRRPQVSERRTHDPDRFVGGLSTRRMRGEDHGVLALDGVDRDANRRDVRTCDGNQRGDHAGRLRIFHEALSVIFFDDAHALLPQRVAQDAEHLGPPARLAAAHAALVDAHVRETLGGGLIGARPCHGLTQPIHARLVPCVDVAHRALCARAKRLHEREFLSRDRSWCVLDGGHSARTSQEARADYGGTPRWDESLYRNRTVTGHLRRRLVLW